MKNIDYIAAPIQWRSLNDWDSHREALYLSLTKRGGLVIELGCGAGSTPLLYDLCGQQKRPFLSFDSDRSYSRNFSSVYIPDWAHTNRWQKHCGLCFIDMKPGEYRKDAIAAMREFAEVIITHDTEPGAIYVYQMEDILNDFRWRLNYQPEGKPHTAIVSDHINIENWI